MSDDVSPEEAERRAAAKPRLTADDLPPAARDWLQNQVAGTIAALQARKGTGGDYFDMRPPDPENSELWRELFPTDGPRPDGEATA
ncbi:MAG TPA: hypothetical protein VI794_01520 [Patescibacteria group bacterium]|nr:hypothetical protein [Patescibacteria group bacterium]